MTWEEYKQAIHAQLSANEIYGDLKNQKSGGGGWITAQCPFHENTGTTNAFEYNPDDLRMHCFNKINNGCEGNDVWDYLQAKTGKKFQELLLEYGDRFGVERPDRNTIKKTDEINIINEKVNKNKRTQSKKKDITEDKNPDIPESLIKKWQENLYNEKAKGILNYLKNKKKGRGLSEEIIKKYELGFAHNICYSEDGTGKNRITIPIRDESGKLVNIRLYSPSATESGRKMLNYIVKKDNSTNKKDRFYRYGSPYKLYGVDELKKYKGNQIIFTGGEFDRLALQTHGFQAVSSTGGEDKFRPEWLEYFKNKDVVIILDCDKAGRNAAREKILPTFTYAETKTFNSIRMVILPMEGTKESNDITNWFREGRTVDELQKVIDSTERMSPNTMQNWLIIQNTVPVKYIPARLAKRILQENHFSYEAEEIYRYKDGYYQNDGKDHIKNSAITYLGDEYTSRRINEVVLYIEQKVKTFPRLDKEYEFINVANGLLKEHTPLDWQLIPHTPAYKTKIQLPLDYDENCNCIEIDKFFKDVLPPDCIDLVYEIFGYVMIPETCYEKSIMLVGKGQNGKSTFLKLLKLFIGKRNYCSVSLQDLIGDKFKPARLRGKLANINADLSGRMLDDNDIFKAIVSGDDVEVEEKFKTSYNFENFARLFFSVNKIPRSRDISDAFYRRWILIMFNKEISESEKDTNLLEKITTKKELSGLLNKALAGLSRLLTRDKFIIPESVKTALENYRIDNDNVLNFLQSRCVISQEYTTIKKDFYLAYKKWCDDSGYRARGKKDFNKIIFANVEVENDRETMGDRNYIINGVGLIDDYNN